MKWRCLVMVASIVCCSTPVYLVERLKKDKTRAILEEIVRNDAFITTPPVRRLS